MNQEGEEVVQHKPVSFFHAHFIHSQSCKKDWLLNFSRKEEII